MLSYQHGYHAGNFADIHKHWILSLILEAMKRKDKPFCYFESHAGRGGYWLTSEQAQRNREWESGLARLATHSNDSDDFPSSWQPYLQALDQATQRDQADTRTTQSQGRPQATSGEYSFYPGSPLLALHQMRPMDRAVFCELHPQESRLLKRIVGKDSRSNVHHRDGLEAMIALSPPPEKRGLVVIDPSYEVKQDYSEIPGLLSKLFRKWRGAVVALWYPVLPANRHEQMLESIRSQLSVPCLFSEFQLAATPRNNTRQGMTGSGMLLCNPPWQIDQTIADGWQFLCQVLGGGAKLSAGEQERSGVRWLIKEYE